MRSLAAALFTLCCSVSAVEFFVAPDGNDAYSGLNKKANAKKNEGPFATLTRAQKAVRAFTATGNPKHEAIIVSVRGGNYSLNETLVFGPDDSGTLENPAVYRAFKNEHPIFSGGVKLGGWQVLPSGLWQTKLVEVAADQWNFSQLFVNGQRRYRPRLPKNGYYNIAEQQPVQPGKHGHDRFVFNDGELKAGWKNRGDVEVLVFHVWFMSRLKLAEVDEKQRIAQFTGQSANADWWGGLLKNNRYIVENVAEALTQPGEWYLDRKTGVLLYYPLPGETPDTAEVIAPRIETLIKFSGDPKTRRWVQHVRLDGLAFEYANWNAGPKGYFTVQAEANLDGAVQFSGARNCELRNCRVAHVGMHGVSFARYAKFNRLDNCELTDLGAGGVKMGELGYPADEFVPRKDQPAPPAGDEPEPVAGHNTVHNCLIAHGGRMHPAGIGVFVPLSPHNIISHNEIYDFYYTGVSLGWSWGYNPTLSHHNLVENNHIHHFGQFVLSDMGGIYTLGVSPGTILRHNLIHDAESFGYGGWGIYHDEGSTGILSEHNIVYRTKCAGFHQHYGRDNILRNNIFAFGEEAQLQRTREEDHLSFTLEQNIFYFDGRPILNGGWQRTDKFKLDRNLYWDVSGKPLKFGKLSWDDWRAKGQDVNSMVADPQFKDPAHGDFTPKNKAALEKIGFVPIDLKGFGRVPPQEKLDDVPSAWPVPK